MSDVPTLPSDQNASGRSFGPEERSYLEDLMADGRLFGPKGRFVKSLEKRYSELMGGVHARAVSSGTAGIHCAIGALDLEPGDEVLTTPITDMGAILPIILCGAVPVFCDVDPDTLNVTAETLERRVTPRTRAAIVTHLFGLPCVMGPIMDLARERGFRVVEDCAQAFLAADVERLVGTIGDIGVFSFQQGKHATCGEGGLVICSDQALARRVRMFGDKAWPYGESGGDHEFLSTNYRMSELQAAVALAQIEKLEANVDHRCRMVARLREAIAPDAPAVEIAGDPTGGRHTYWRIPLMVDLELIRGGADALGKALGAHGVVSMPRYIRKPAYECQVIREQRTFGRSRWPFTLWEEAYGRPYRVDPDDFPGTYLGLSRVVVLPWNEQYRTEHVDFVAEKLREAVCELREKPPLRSHQAMPSA